jgi:hypothetical protein
MKTSNQSIFLRRSGIAIAAAVSAVLAAGTVVAAPAIPVTVTNVPSVNAHITDASVAVRNSGASPLYVDTDSSARTNFNASCNTPNVDSTYGQASCTLLTIPAGRQIVIETVSCQAEAATGSGPADVQLIVPNAPLAGGAIQNVSHLLTLSRQAGDSTLEIWRMTTALRAYGRSPDSGTVSVGLFYRSNYVANTPVSIVCAISGYMIGL